MTMTVTMAKEKDLINYYDGMNAFFNTVEVEVEAETVEEAVEAVNGYKRMVAWKVNDEEVW